MVVQKVVMRVASTDTSLAAQMVAHLVVMMDTCSATKDVKIGRGFTII